MNSERRSRRAKSWLRRARLDYAGFERVSGLHYSSRKNVPLRDPALSVYLLQQAVEKAVKAIAVASGEFETKEFTRDYQHHSLKLFLDFYLKVLELPSIKHVISAMPDFGWPSIDEARAKLNELKENTVRPREDRPVQLPNWWNQLATLPRETVLKTVSMLTIIRETAIKSVHKLLKGRSRVSLTMAAEYVANPSIDTFRNMLALYFETKFQIHST